MAQNHTVKQGDCISSIAYEYGFFPDTIWNHPQNKELKEKRKDPNVLFPGDVVYVPDKRVKEVSKATDQQHRFRYKAGPAYLNLVLLYDGEPLANETYELDVEGVEANGVTDGNGRLREPIDPEALNARLFVGEGSERIEYALRLGRLMPIDTVEGFKCRLHNLDYSVGALDSAISEEFQASLKEFEFDHELDITGKINETNRGKLKEIYGL